MVQLDFLLVTLVLLESPAPAVDGPVTLSLAEAQERAAARAPEVKLANGRVLSAAATRIGAGVRVPVNPRLALDARPGLDAGTRGKVGLASTLDLLMEVGDVPGARLAEADRRTRSAEAEAAVVRLEARLQATLLYVGVQLGELRLGQARDTIALAERLVAAARERRGAGAASDIDVTSASVELAERRALLHAAEAERRHLDGELRELLALPVSAPLRLTSTVDNPARLPALPQLLARTASRHPDLEAIEARLQLLAAADERLRKEARPKLGLYAGVDASPASPLFGVLGLSIELPFFQRAQGPRAVVAADRQIELARLEQARRRIDQLLRANHAAYELRFGELEVLSREGIPAAEERLKLVEEGWRAGRFDVFRLVAAAQDLARLRSMRLDVLQRLWQERLVLERLTGGWSDDRS
jgi:outer membrane protein TolC